MSDAQNLLKESLVTATTSAPQDRLSLLTIPKDVRFLIWDKVFAEVQYAVHPWCRDCGFVQKKEGHKPTRHLPQSCNGSMIWMWQPSPSEVALLFINQEMHYEMMPFFDRAPIRHRKDHFDVLSPLGLSLIKPLSKVVFPRSIRARVQTYEFSYPTLACLGQEHVGFPVDWPNINKVVLQEPNPSDARNYAYSVLDSIFQALQSQALGPAEGEANEVALSSPATSTPMNIQGPFNNPHMENQWKLTIHQINYRNIKIEFPVIFRVRVLEYLEWPFRPTLEDSDWTESAKISATWDKSGLTFRNADISDLRQKWWYSKWQARRGVPCPVGQEKVKEDAKPTFGHFAGRQVLHVMCLEHTWVIED